MKLFRRRSALIFLVEPRVAAFERDLAARDPHAFHVRAEVEDVAIARDERGFLVGFERAEAITEARRTVSVSALGIAWLLYAVQPRP